MGTQTGILISEVCVRNVAILASEINRGAAAGCEQLHAVTMAGATFVFGHDPGISIHDWTSVGMRPIGSHSVWTLL